MCTGNPARVLILYSEGEFVELLLSKTILLSVDGSLLFLWTRKKEGPVNLFLSSCFVSFRFVSFRFVSSRLVSSRLVSMMRCVEL